MFELVRRGTRTSGRSRVLVTLMLAAALPLTACAQSSNRAEADTSAAAPVEESAFPVTVHHAFGDTVVEAEPTRILALDTAAADTAIALGVTPIAMQRNDWAGDEDGFLPWTRAELDRSGQTLPDMASFYSEDGGLMFEQILSVAPDLILAPYSGFSEQDYERLSEIAPTLPYDSEPYQPSSWQNLAHDVGTLLGRPARTEELVRGTEDTIAQAKSDHPEFAGVTFAFGSYLREGETNVGIYKPGDPRVQFVENLGLTVAPDVVTGSEKAGGSSFTYSVSLEELDRVETDVFLGWASEQAEVDATLDQTLFAKWPVVAAGKDLWITDNRLTSATMYVSILAAPWATTELVPQLSEIVSS
ncbi:ABC transporter substrate-binding protein [Rhodococcoides yunnanense]|uniref:ABC transporter substrate-binding protein n=1 Tax=Rhodococcoides yunnanense TaxID=278209 RepID=UPI001FEA2792|nr:ABC transporter substrate-binding protein [Rhodococcus yunnanensis]